MRWFRGAGRHCDSRSQMALAIRGVAFDLDGETLEVLHDVDLEVSRALRRDTRLQVREIDFAAGWRRPRPTARGDDPRRRRADPKRGTVACSKPERCCPWRTGCTAQCLARPGGARPVEEPCARIDGALRLVGLDRFGSAYPRSVVVRRHVAACRRWPALSSTIRAC